jgi:hypothetical protein
MRIFRKEYVMYNVHRLSLLRLDPTSSPDRSAKVVALRSRSEARRQDRAEQRDPGRSPPRAAA